MCIQNSDSDPGPGIKIALNCEKMLVKSSIADPDPGSVAFLTLGSGIRNTGRFFPDPGSGITDPGSRTQNFESLVTIFLGIKFYDSFKIGPNFFLNNFKNKK
jgi:hypothetical protein